MIDNIRKFVAQQLKLFGNDSEGVIYFRDGEKKNL